MSSAPHQGIEIFNSYMHLQKRYKCGGGYDLVKSSPVYRCAID